MRLTLVLSILLLTVHFLCAQNLPKLTYSGTNNILNNVSIDGNFLGGISGISYDHKSNRFYAITDNSQGAEKNISKNAVLYSFTIAQEENLLKVEDIKSSTLKEPLNKINGESIRATQNGFIIADEGEEKSKLLYVSKEGELIDELYSETEISYNRGFEGAVLDSNQKSIYFGLERPVTVDAVRGGEENLGVIPIFQLDLKSKDIIGQYLYPLHLPPQDHGLSPKQIENFRNDNGVTELLLYNDSTMLFLERAFIDGDEKKLHVRIYSAVFSENENIAFGNFELLKPQLIFDLYDHDLAFIADNLEGMTFGPGNEYLYLISDDNFDRYGEQQTQIISFKVD